MVLSFVTRWTDLEDIVRTEQSLGQVDTYCMISYAEPKKTQLKAAGSSRMVVTRSRERGVPEMQVKGWVKEEAQHGNVENEVFLNIPQGII